MRQTVAGVFFHVVLTTRWRAPVLGDPVAGEVRALARAIAAELDCELLAAGGMPDHLHLLVHLASDMRLTRFVEHMKIRCVPRPADGAPSAPIAWQEGYVAFIVPSRELKHAADHILQQADHHRHITLQEEILILRHRGSRTKRTPYSLTHA